MKIRIWGAQGSLPAPLKPEAVQEKLIETILAMPELDTNDPEVVRAYVEGLPPLLRGTAKGNTSCVEVQAGGETFIVDAGTGIRELGLALMKGPCGRGQGKLHLLFSHPHWDHIQGFPFFVPAFIPGNQITCYSIHDLEYALTQQQRYLFFPVALNKAQADRELAQLTPDLRQRYPFIYAMQADLSFVRLEAGTSFSVGPVRITTRRNYHPGDTYSYRFEDQHSIFIYGGDAEYKDLDAPTFEERVTFFKDADAVIFDAQYGLRDSWENKVDFGHSSAMIGVDFARRAGVKTLLLTHHEPTYSDHQLQEVQETATAYQAQDPTLPPCEVIVAYEGLELDLTPPDAVAQRHLADDGAAVLTPGSLFDEEGVAQLLTQLTGGEGAETPQGAIVDLSQVKRLTTASLKTLVTFSRQRAGGPLVLAAPSASVQAVIRLGGYGDYFATYPTVDEAVKAVQAREALNLPGQTLNQRYQIVETLSQSPVGTVLKVIDQVAGRPVALRVLSPTFEEATLDRFVAQMQPLLALEHDHIAQIYACTRSQEGDYTLLVEELLAGPTLAERLHDEADPLSADEALDLALDLTLALEYAHSLGVIHGNLKPQDIFLTEAGLKIGGFNLARLEEGRNLRQTPLPYVTASHLAPEQILGQPLDARTDLYALGVILYQLFTAQLPFTGSDSEVLQAHLEQDPLPPREHNPRLSRAVEHQILKLLAKNPNQRYASAQQTRQISSSLMFNTAESTQPARQPLVGRSAQLQVLQDGWQTAAAGRGQLLFITGEPGIGKTRLVRQFALQSQAPIVLIGTCQEQAGSPPYHPLSQVLQAYLDTVPPELAEPEVRRWLSHLSPLLPDLNQRLPDLPPAADLDPQAAQLRLMSSLTQFIKRATQFRPWLLLLDDLQWLDEGSLEALRYLGRHLPQMPLLLVGTYRHTELDSQHPLPTLLRDLGQTPTYRRLPLGRLDQTEVAQVLAQLWHPSVPEALTQTIYRHTEGNPLYVEEVAQGLIDDGLVTVQGSTWHFPTVASIRLPQSIYEAVERRVHYLSAETRDVLAQAAVLGQTFRFDDLVTMSGLSDWTLLDHLDLALERQLVQELAGGQTLRFRHTEVHHVIYHDLGTLRRRRLHRRAAETIEEQAQPEPERLADELAHHFRQAGELVRALTYSIPAAQQAQAAYANETALLWYERTLTMLEQLEPDQKAAYQPLQLTTYQSLGEVLYLMGQYDDALTHYASARALLDLKTLSSDETRQMAELHRLTAYIHLRRGQYDTALEWLDEGISKLDSDEPTLEVARIYLLRAWIYFRQAKYDEALAWCQSSLDIASQTRVSEGQTVTAEVYLNLGEIHRLRGDLEQGIRYCRGSLQIYQRIEDVAGQIMAYINLGIAYYDQGDWVQASHTYSKSLAMAQEIGDIVYQGHLTNNLGNIYLVRGEWVQAANLFEQSLTIAQQIGLVLNEAVTRSNLAKVHICQGQWTEAESCLSLSQSLFAEIGNEQFLPELQRRWGELYLKTDELEQALTCTRHSIDLAVALGDALEEGRSRRMLGQVHMARNERDLAEAQLHHSLQILSDLDSHYELAKTKLALASLMRESNHSEKAQGYLDQATETFERLGAKADLTEAQKLAQESRS